MKLRLPEHIRARIAEKYLDWAEAFPGFNLGPARSLRIIREHHRSRSEDAFTRSRAPNQTTLKFSSIRLFEVFHLENFDQLYDGLVKLLPGLTESPVHKRFVSEFDHQSRSLSGTSWQKVGYLTRDRMPFLVGLDAHRKIPDLPEDVWLIEVDLHRILPSIFAVTLDVLLTDSATERLVEMQSRRYLPRILFHRIIPLKRLGQGIHLGGHSESNPEDEMKRVISGWLDKLRSEVERCIKPYLNGYFMN